MANQIIIDIGAAANDGTGDPLRTAFNYVNNNFSNVWNTGLPTSNVQFLDNKILTVNTNANLVLAPNGIGKVASNVDIVPNTANVFALGSSTRRWNTVYGQYLDLSHNAIIGGNLVVTGNLSAGNISYTSNVFVGDLEGSVFDGASSIVLDVIDSTIYVDNYRYANGTPVSFSGTPSGSNTQIQFNNAGSFGGSAAFTFDRTSNVLSVLGNISTGNASITNLTSSNLVNGRTGTFTGDQYSDGAMYIGSPAGTVLGSDVVIQITANAGGYSQTNFQNINNSPTASSDYILTADNGNDTTHYLDMGITSSGWDGSETNVLAGLVANNGYLYVQDGNLTVGVRNGSTSYAWNFDTAGNLSFPGSITTDNTDLTLSVGISDWVFDETGVLTAPGEIETVGNISAGYFLGNGSQLTGIVSSYGNSNVAAYLPTYTGNIGAGNVTVTTPTGNLVFGKASATGSPGVNSTNSFTVVTDRFGTPKEWVFGTSGFSGDGNITGSNLITTGNIATDWLNIGNVGNTATLQADVSLQIVANVSGSAPYWTFNTDGTLYVPGNIVGDNNGPLYIDGIGSGEGYISLPNTAFGGEQITIVNQFSLGNGIALATNGGIWHFDNGGNLTAPGTITATGNVSGGNITTAGVMRMTHAVGAQGEMQFSDGVGSSFIVEVGTSAGTWAGAGSLNLITSSSPGGNIGIFVAQSERAKFTTVGANITGTLGVTGNINGANLVTTGNVVGNVNGYSIGYRNIPQLEFAGDVQVSADDSGKHYYNGTNTSYTVSILDSGIATYPVGTAITIVNKGTGNILVWAYAGVSLYMAGSSTTGNRTVGAYGMATLLNVDTDVWMINGTGVY